MDKHRFFEGVESYRLLAKHEVGQNFLVDYDVAERIVNLLDIQKGEDVLEIGSGAGSLTFFLSETNGEINAIDIDEALIAKLQNELGDKVSVTYGNGAKWNYAPYDKIIGNLPYYITSLLVERAILTGTKAKRMVFMVQKEAGERLLASPGTKDYAPLPILIALSAYAKRAFNVRRSCFAPAPHVDSSVLVFDMKAERDEDVLKTYKLCQSLFLQRRKTLLNNLKNYLHDDEKARGLIASLGLRETVRPEEVTPEQYLSLTKRIK
ncbi:MAG: ribosomal RNA small subunit methyltransferase A [Erysipelotrichaceae bacterium]|nr:ribosomal RNA small subunit methyltransferase A [Erysipelotrichaceae bacterium]